MPPIPLCPVSHCIPSPRVIAYIPSCPSPPALLSLVRSLFSSFPLSCYCTSACLPICLSFPMILLTKRGQRFLSLAPIQSSVYLSFSRMSFTKRFKPPSQPVTHLKTLRGKSQTNTPRTRMNKRAGNFLFDARIYTICIYIYMYICISCSFQTYLPRSFFGRRKWKRGKPNWRYETNIKRIMMRIER